MSTFIKYLISFSITHLFFFIFIFFGLGIFIQVPDDISSKIYLDIAGLCIVATLFQAFTFTILNKFVEIEGVGFFLTALLVELLVSNTLFYYFVNNRTSWDELPGFVLMNACLVGALLISMVIKEYNARLSY